VNAVRKVIADKIAGLVGGSSTATSIPMAELTQRTKLPYVSALASAPTLAEKNYPNTVMMNNPSPQKEQVLVDHFGSDAEVKTVAMILENNDFAKGLLAQYQAGWKAAGPKIVYSGFFQNAQADFSALVARAKASHADALYIVGFPEQYSKIIAQAKGIGFTPKVIWLNGEALSPVAIKSDPEGLEGVLSANVFNPDGTAAETVAFADAYKAANGVAPGFLAASTYDAVRWMAQAIDDAGTATDPAKIDAALRKVDYMGPRGHLQLDGNGQVQLTPSIIEVKGAKMVAAPGH
jgi:branched-chain amino acid transport system substrate-binding protein